MIQYDISPAVRLFLSSRGRFRTRSWQTCVTLAPEMDAVLQQFSVVRRYYVWERKRTTEPKAVKVAMPRQNWPDLQNLKEWFQKGHVRKKVHFKSSFILGISSTDQKLIRKNVILVYNHYTEGMLRCFESSLSIFKAISTNRAFSIQKAWV